MKKIFLHIGVHRTATTSLQSYLRENKEFLTSHSIGTPDVGFAMGASHQLAWSFLNDLPSHYPVSTLSTEALFEDLIEEIDARPESTFILSSEDFCLIDKDSTHNTPSLVTLAQFLQKYDVKVVLYLRNQVEFISSYLNQAIKAYDTRINPHTADAVHAYFKNVLNYESLLSRWSKVFGKDNVVARSYHRAADERGIVADFLSLCDLNVDIQTTPQTNRSLDEETLAFRKYLNTLPISSHALADLEGALSSLSKNTPATTLHRTAAVRFQETYTEINKVVTALSAPRNAVSFLPTIHAENYPESLSDTQLSFNDTFRLATAMYAQIAYDQNKAIKEATLDLYQLRKDVFELRNDTHQIRSDFHQQRHDFYTQREELYQLREQLSHSRAEFETLKKSHPQQIHLLQENHSRSEQIAADFALMSFQRAQKSISPRRRFNETFGRDEKIIQTSSFFDESYYRDVYLQDSNTNLSPAKHYLKIGAAAGYNPSAHFNTVEYIYSHAHVALAGINPVVHAEQTGFTLPKSELTATIHSKRHIVILDHEVPKFDQNAGARHTYHYIKLFLALGYDITFLPFCDDPVDFDILRELRQLGITVLTHEEEHHTWTAHVWHGWLETNKNHIDLVYIHRPHVAEHYMAYCKESLALPIWYMCHDLHYLRLEREAVVNSESREHALAMKEKEKHFFSLADLNFTPSTEEERLVREEFNINTIHTLPLYLYDELPATEKRPARQERILFVGSFQHQPNEDGLRWFLDKIYPRVKEKWPIAMVDIVGKNPPSEFTARDDNQLTFHGYVSDSDLEALYAKVKVVIMPLRYGAGVKGKVLEAMHHGVPFVATSCALEGIPELSNIVSASDDEESFANDIIEFLKKSDDDIQSLANQFAKIIQASYSMQAGENIMVPLLDIFISRSSRTN